MNALILLFYRIVTFFTRVPKKTRHEHIEIFDTMLSKSNFFQSNYINNQWDFSDFPYGKGNIGLNGCGPVAVFNALVALKEIDTSCEDNTNVNNSFIDILHFFEKYGAALHGRFGTSPLVIRRYFSENGFITDTFKKKSPLMLNDFSNDFSAFVSIIINDKNDLRKGLHFICSKKNDVGTFTTHNPEHTGSTLFDALNKCSNDEIQHVYTIGIKKSEAS